jgi:uncharacterized protein YukE
LNNVEQRRLDAAINRFEQAVARRRDRFTEKAHRELNSRTQQWDNALTELIRDPSPAYYRSDVDKRAMITTLLEALRLSPAQQREISERVARLDERLRQHWVDGPFIWPDEWQPAYPPAEYWWLYGRIK